MWCTQACNQLGTPGEAKGFLRGAQIFKPCPIAFSFNYVLRNFPWDREFFSGGQAYLVTGLGAHQKGAYKAPL